MGFLKKLGGVFVETGEQPGDGAVVEPDVDAPDGTPLTNGAATADPNSESGGGNTAGVEAILVADFPEIFAQAGVQGDPNADALLAAYAAGMDTIPEDARRTAVKAMAGAMHADVKTVVPLLTARVNTLKTAITGAKQHISDAQSRQSADLAELSASTDERVRQLQEQINRLRHELEQKTAAVAQSNATQSAAVSGFEIRLNAEATRLGTVLSFFNQLAMPAKK